MNQLSADAKARVAALCKELSAKLIPTIDSVMAMPVVGDRIKPLAEGLRTKLNALAPIEAGKLLTDLAPTGSPRARGGRL